MNRLGAREVAARCEWCREVCGWPARAPDSVSTQRLPEGAA
jgi:hypothetical protein